jgi:hypothetical protein
VTILVMDLLQRHRAFGLDWWEAGMSRAGLIRDGEWWRTLTALSLHADPLHLVGNLVFGLVFGFLTGQLLGWGLAWSGMLLAGALGNALNALIHSPSHASIGASTAVFATLGILAAYSWKQRRHLVNRWLPFGGGVALLAFLGMGGGRTDIFAHVTGFALPVRRALRFAGAPPPAPGAAPARPGPGRLRALRPGLGAGAHGAGVSESVVIPVGPGAGMAVLRNRYRAAAAARSSAADP